MTTFVDTNVLIYLLDEGEKYHTWAQTMLATCKQQGPTVIADIVYAEFSAGMPSKEAVDTVITKYSLERLGHSDAALFTAGQTFKRYKEENNGPKLNVLPDFLIGALAEANGAPLMTANPKDFVGYFPALTLIAP